MPSGFAARTTARSQSALEPPRSFSSKSRRTDRGLSVPTPDSRGSVRRNEPGCLFRAFAQAKNIVNLLDQIFGKAGLGEKRIPIRLAIVRERAPGQRDDRDAGSTAVLLQAASGFPSVHDGQRQV